MKKIFLILFMFYSIFLNGVYANSVSIESQSCIRKKRMLERHKKNNFLLNNKYSLYSDNMAQLVFNDTKIYLKKIENIYLGDIIINDYKIKFIPIGNENKEKQQILQNYFDTLTKDTLISDCNIEIYDEKDFKSLLFSDLIIRFSVLMKND